MINYDVRKWGFCSLFYVTGSVFPKAFGVALPSALLAMLVHQAVNHWDLKLLDGSDVTAGVVGGYSAILGFLINTRASKAYSRWWEGGTLLQQLRGEWFNAFSSLLAFCSTDPEKREAVYKFEQTMLRLMSLLYCCGLQQVSTHPAVPKEDFEVIDIDALAPASMEFLEQVNDKVEVVLQWIQRLIVENIKSGVLPIAPPIISRVFQEYSRGIVNLNNARKIADFPFPFPLAQCITLMLCIHWLLIPLTCGTNIKSVWWAGLLTFVVVFSFWCIHFFSIELEMPFGRSTNHLPLKDMLADMNRSLKTLLKPLASTPPVCDVQHAKEANMKKEVKEGFTGITDMPAPEKLIDARTIGSGPPAEVSAKKPGESPSPDGGSRIVAPETAPEVKEVSQLDTVLEPAALRQQLQQMVPDVPGPHVDELLQLALEHSKQVWDSPRATPPNTIPTPPSHTLREIGVSLSFLRSQPPTLPADGITQSQKSSLSKNGCNGIANATELHTSLDKILKVISNETPEDKLGVNTGG